MRALIINSFEGPAGLAIAEVEDPVPRRGEVLVDVRAVGLNRADLLQSLGLYPPPPPYPPERPGLELMGVVSKAGGGFRKGERVVALVPGGAFAEKVALNGRHLLRVPKRLSDTDAAGMLEAFTTAWDALWLQAGARPGHRALIHAVGSGVGTAAVQLCRAWGVTSIGTSRTQDKLDRAQPDVPILVGDPPLFSDRTGPVDVCLDLVGGTYFAQTLEAMVPRGTVMVVGLTAGPSAEVPLRMLLSKRLRVMGTTLRSRDDRERALLTSRFAKEVMPLFARGKIKTSVTLVKPMSEAASAFEAMASNQTFGKTVLTW